MTASIYEALKDCIGAPLADIQQILDVIAIDLFEPLWMPEPAKEGESAKERDFQDCEVASVIMYTVYAYSKESKMLVFGSDFINEKVRIADKVQLPFYLHGKCLKLKSDVFRSVMLKYLDYQGSRAFKHLQLKKDMYEATENNNFNTLFTSDFNIKDVENIMKVKDRLLEEINTYEDQLRSELKFIYDNREEVKSFEDDRNSRRGEKIDNGNLENSRWINFNTKNKSSAPDEDIS